MKPKYILINFSKGELVGCADDEDTAKAQLKKCASGSHFHDTYLIAEVKIMSETKRVES